MPLCWAVPYSRLNACEGTLWSESEVTMMTGEAAHCDGGASILARGAAQAPAVGESLPLAVGGTETETPANETPSRNQPVHRSSLRLGVYPAT